MHDYFSPNSPIYEIANWTSRCKHQLVLYYWYAVQYAWVPGAKSDYMETLAIVLQWHLFIQKHLLSPSLLWLSLKQQPPKWSLIPLWLLTKARIIIAFQCTFLLSEKDHVFPSFQIAEREVERLICPFGRCWNSGCSRTLLRPTKKSRCTGKKISSILLKGKPNLIK